MTDLKIQQFKTHTAKNIMLKKAWDEWHSGIGLDAIPGKPNASFEAGYRAAERLAKRKIKHRAKRAIMFLKALKYKSKRYDQLRDMVMEGIFYHCLNYTEKVSEQQELHKTIREIKSFRNRVLDHIGGGK